MKQNTCLKLNYIKEKDESYSCMVVNDLRVMLL